MLGNYVIEGVLGAGGMGHVYAALHRRLGRRVAIKLLLPQYSCEPDMLGRFFNEARASSLIEHPGIVQILDCDLHSSGRAYIVMEHLMGESLGHALTRAPRLGADFGAAIEIASQVAGALAAAHGKGIVHRDLKPDNVFLVLPAGREAAPFVKVLDFGVAKLLDGAGGDAVSRTRTGSLLGTPRYMSPEQCRSAGGVDHRSDIYSLGCICFEMLCGRAPFVSEAITDLLVAHATTPPPRPAALGIHDVPADLEALVLAMLAKEPAQRPQSMAEVVTALGAIAARLPAVAGAFRVHVARAGEAFTDHDVSTIAPPRPFERRHDSMRLDDSQPPVSPAIGPGGLANRAGRAWPRSALAVLGLAVVGGALWMHGREQTSQSLAPRAVIPEPKAVPPPAPAPRATIRVEITNAPAGLSVLVDGVATALPIELARDGKPRQLELRAQGFQPEARVVHASDDQTLALALRPVPATPPAPPARRRPARRSPVRAEKLAPAVPQVDSPQPVRKRVEVITDL
jgi:serine/threonine protein kinase